MRQRLLPRLQAAVLGLGPLLAAAWMLILMAQPVHIPILELSREYSPLHTRALSGVKGQTLIAPSGDLSRIDVWVTTNIRADDYTRVKFDLIRDKRIQESLASGLVIFDRSGEDWQARLVFSPDLVSEGDKLYLRLESVLSSPEAQLYFAYFPRNLYGSGDLLDLDRMEVPGQDLRFKLYRNPSFPKPFAWVEAIIAPAVAAARKSAGPSAWAVSLLTIVTFGLGATVLFATAVVAAQILTVRHRRRAVPALVLVLTALATTIIAGAEAPIGKLWVPLV